MLAFITSYSNYPHGGDDSHHQLDVQYKYQIVCMIWKLYDYKARNLHHPQRYRLVNNYLQIGAHWNHEISMGRLSFSDGGRSIGARFDTEATRPSSQKADSGERYGYKTGSRQRQRRGWLSNHGL